MRLSSISFVLALALAGCAARAPLNPASQVTGLIELPVESSRSIQLPTTMHYTVPSADRAAAGTARQFALIAGTYRPYKYNQAGTFYLGEQPAIVERNAAAGAIKTTLRVGGVWIPTDQAAAPKLFILSDYYKQLDDGAPLPDRMTATNLSEFQQKRPALNTHDAVAPMFDPTSGLPIARSMSPLQFALSTAAATTVLVLLSDSYAPRDIAFATGDIADPDAVKQIRAAFAPGRTYAGI